MRSIRILTASTPIAAMGWRTVVSWGRAMRPATMPSNPVTATCPGTSTPSCRSASMSASATSSLSQTNASGNVVVAHELLRHRSIVSGDSE